jgi:hypothetical protein
MTQFTVQSVTLAGNEEKSALNGRSITKVQSLQLVIRPITDDGLNLNLAVVQGQKYGLEQFGQADVVKAIDLCE